MMSNKPAIKPLILALALAGTMMAPAAQAGERESLEQLRTTTLSLIELLVQEGVLSKSKAEALVRESEAAKLASDRQQALAQADAAAGAPEASAEGQGNVVRVQYVPEHVKKEMREEIKKEVMAKLNYKAGERLGLPSWIDRIQWEGDIRLRYENDMFPAGNETPVNLSLQGIDIDNTSEDRERWRVRARLGAKLNISETFKGGIRVVTGSIDDPVSPNQTLGNGGDKFSFALDRAYLTYQPFDWLSFTGGRMGNPWFSTDLVWDPDMAFDGLLAALKPRFNDKLKGFATIGAFPIEEVESTDENAFGQAVSADDKWLYGAQAGIEWAFTDKASLKLGVAYYDYKDVQGIPNEFGSTAYSRTAPHFRQKGNTVYDINANNFLSPTLSGGIAGLASDFRLLNLTGTMDWTAFGRAHVILTGDYVRNLGFSEKEVQEKLDNNLSVDLQGSPIGGDTGWMTKLLVGMPETVERHEWNVYGVYKRLETNAVLDAYTDSDFHLGGTNAKGWIIGGNYGVDKNTWLSLRWLTADEIDGPPLSIDVLQVDLNAKF